MLRLKGLPLGSAVNASSKKKRNKKESAWLASQMARVYLDIGSALDLNLVQDTWRLGKGRKEMVVRYLGEGRDGKGNS